jgi:uncharacterized protein involved in response to NO
MSLGCGGIPMTMPVVAPRARTPVEWRREPFRMFFPCAVLIGWIGVGHWLLYATGLTATYSGFLHGQVMTQAFMMALAVGFLMTALPRRTQSDPPSVLEVAIAFVALATVTAAALTGRWALAQGAYAGLFLLLLQFAVRRFLGQGAKRRPPASFVLVPIAVAHGLAGALLIAAATRPGTAPWVIALGRLFVEQGVFLSLAIGIGSLVLPLMSGETPPADLGSSPAERRKLLGYAAIGGTLAVSMILEAAGFLRFGPLLRGLVVATGLAVGGGAWRPPRKPGLHRRLVWLAVWLMPVGLFGAALAPDLRIAMLHVLFIGGFGLMGFGVATHVSLAHLDLERLALGRPPAVAALGVLMVLAMLARVGADFSAGYFDHLGWAAALWLAGSGIWLGFVGPKLLRYAPPVSMPAPPKIALGPVAAYLVADHQRLETLLTRATAQPNAIDLAAYGEFRRGLLRHIAMEEKILLPAAARARGGVPLPAAARLRRDHGAIAALLVPAPTSAIVAALRLVLAGHNLVEEGPAGVYATCERLVGPGATALAAALRAAPEVPVHAPVDDPRVLATTRRALERAGYDPALV